MANLTGIKNLLFDFGGVIVSIDKHPAIKRFKELGVDNIEDYVGEYHQKGIFMDLEDGTITRDEFYKKFRELTKKQVSNEEIDSGWLAFLTGVPEYKLHLLEKLRKKYNLYLLSNTNSVIMEWAHSDKFSTLGTKLSDYFDKMFCSYQIGYTKPAKESFQAVIDGAGLNPKETLFLDDSQSNLDVAKQMGFQTCLINQNEDLRKVFE